METALLDETIFVYLPSYNDLHTAYTLLDLYKQARHPNRIYVGVMQVITEAAGVTLDVLEKYRQLTNYLPEDFSDNIRVYSARSLDAVQKAPSLYRGEKYAMQITSRTTFPEKWDQKAIQQLESASASTSTNPILTAIPSTDTKKPTFIRVFKDGSGSALLLEAHEFNKRPKSGPIPALFWAHNFVFGYGEVAALFRVPSNYMAGELAFLKGWHLFHPNIVLALAEEKTTPLGAVSGSGKSGYEKWCGVNAKGQVVSRIAYLGFNHVQPERQQILQKYGSVKETSAL